MPLPSPQDLARLSRDRNALLKLSLALVTLSFGLAFLVSLSPWGDGGGDPDPVERPPATIDALVDRIRFTPFPGGRSCADLGRAFPRKYLAELVEASLEDFASDPEAAPLRIWWRGLLAEDSAEAVAALEALPPDSPRRDEFLADLHYLAGAIEPARRHYLAAAEQSADPGYAQRSVLFLARFEEDRGLLGRLLDDPSYRAALRPLETLAYRAALRDYAGMAWAAVLVEADLLASSHLPVALFTAAIWFLILMSFQSRGRAYLALALPAFLLGIAGATLTVYAAVIQEELRGFTAGPADSEVKQFIYLLAGVSLREEFLKLLCFLPLAFARRKRGAPLEALLLAGCVGLGFAFQENLSYFQRDATGYAAWMRLLTANALHFSLTGVAGLALWRMLARRGRGWEDFLLTFLAVVLAHAVYNAVLSVPSLAEYSPLHPILVAVIAYKFFDPLRQHLEIAGLHRRLSPLGLFVVGSTLLACGILVASAFGTPFRHALGAFAGGIAAMIPLAFAFIGRFRDL